jgi:hypothetical protein
MARMLDELMNYRLKKIDCGDWNDSNSLGQFVQAHGREV